jgi:spermidine synthase
MAPVKKQPPLEILEHQLDEDAGSVVFSTRVGKNTVEVREDELFRWLRFNEGITQSAILKSAPDALLFSYTRAMMTFLLFQQNPDTLFMLGLGGGSHARFVARELPQTKVVALERSKRLAEIADEHFGLPSRSPKFKVAYADAGKWIGLSELSADTILVDLFDAHDVNALVLKRRFYTDCRARLHGNGVLVVNLMVTREHDEESLLQPLMEAFDGRVLPMAADEYGNYIVLAFKSELDERGFKALRKRAVGLQKKFELPFPRYLDRLREAQPADTDEFVFSKSATTL